jgi:hypothetical protein
MGIMNEAHHSFKGSTVACTTEVSHRPYCRPEADDIVDTWQLNRRLDVTPREAKFIPVGGVRTAEKGK